jgi:hypothetical protein
MSDDRPTLPWSLSDARLTFTAGAVGWALLLMSWWGASGTGKQSSQTNWLVLGIGAIVLMALGYLFWVHAGRRAVRQRRDAVVERLERVATASPPTTSERAIASRAWVASPAGGRYHREDCLLVRGKDVRRLDGGSRSLAALRPCEMCRP